MNASTTIAALRLVRRGAAARPALRPLPRPRRRRAPRAPLVRLERVLSVEERVDLLAALDLFSGLRPGDLLPLASATEFITFEPGQNIVRQGDPGDSIYVIVSGRVQVLARIDSGGLITETAISRLGPGETLGELSLLDNQPRSATCVALTSVTCLRLGRDDFLAALERHWTLSRALLAVLARRQRLTDARLAEHARDPLTGLYSRRALAEIYAREVKRAQRAARSEAAPPQPLSVLFGDVNRFKEINDRFGHQTGDEVLRAVGRSLRAATRATDIAARYGGDEFVVLLPESGLGGARLVADRIRRALRESPPGPVPFSMCFGIAQLDLACPQSLEALLGRADAEMYREKGRLALA